MTTSWKLATIVGVVAGLLALAFTFTGAPSLNQSLSIGAVGPKLAENYDPYIKYNGGYFSQLPIKTTADFLASSTSLTAGVGCLQLHATSTATWIKQVYVTTGATSTFNGTVFWSYGTCSSTS